MQEAPKAHHSKKSSGPSHGCPLSGQHSDNNQPIANNCQYGNEIAQEARDEKVSPQQTVKMSFNDITDTLNVLIDDGLSIGNRTLDLIAPSN